MGSILLVLVFTIILFVSISDFVQFYTEPLEQFSVFHQHGNFHEEEGPKATACHSPQTVVFASERIPNFDLKPNQKDQVAASEAPFERPYIPCSAIRSDGDTKFDSLEMPPLQKNLLWKARVLRTMRSAVAFLPGPGLCATSSPAVSTTSSMEARSMDHGGRLANRPVDPVSQAASVTKKEVQKAGCMEQCRQRKRPWRCHRSTAKLWASAITGYAIAGASLVGWDGTVSDYQLRCIVPQHHSQLRPQGGQRARETHEVVSCGLEEVQGRLARGIAIFSQRSDHQKWPGRNQVPPLSSVATRQSQEGAPRSADCAPCHARCMEELLSPISGPVVQIYGAVHAAGTSNDGQAQGRPGELDGCKGKPWSLQSLRWLGKQGRCGDAERCRGPGPQGCRDVCRPENRSKLSGLGFKSPNTAQTSRTGRAARGRAKPASQETKNERSRPDRHKQCGRWQIPLFWGARVNTFAPSIAHGLPPQCDPVGLTNFAGSLPRLEANCAFRAFHDAFHDDHAVLPWSHLAMKWNHSVLSEVDFVDEWLAADRAFHLAHEVGFETARFFAVSTDAHANFRDQSCAFESVQCSSVHHLYKDFGVHSLQSIPTVCNHHLQDMKHTNFVASQSLDQPCDILFAPCCEVSRLISVTSPAPSTSQCTVPDGCLAVCSSGFDAPSTSNVGIAVSLSEVGDSNDVAGWDNLTRVGHAPLMNASPRDERPHKSSIARCHAHHVAAPLGTPRANDRTVHFCSDIALYIGCEDQWKFHQLLIPEEALVMSHKPWSLIQPDAVFSRAQFCNDDQRETVVHHTSSMACRRPLNYSTMPQIPRDSHPTVRVSHNEDKMFQPLEAQSRKRNLCFGSRFEPGYSGQLPSQLITHYRREHESPIGWMPQHDNLEDEELDEEQPPNDHDQQPAFLRLLRDRFHQLGFDIFDGDFEIPIRTWFLDHVTMRRWTSPRILQLVGPPHTWEQQFSSLWVDQIDTNDWFDLSIVEPDPPRTARHSFVMVDAILTQSLHMDRFPGLVTVMPEQFQAFEMFSVAYSFADFISGFDIVLAADAASMCRYHPCTITFGWDEIPHSLRPQHVMRPGDGFQVTVRPGRLQLTALDQRNPTQASSSNEPPAQPTVDASTNLTFSTPEHPMFDDPTHRRFTTPLHLFQLDAHEVIC